MIARKKAEREALLAQEEASITTKKAAPKAGAKKKAPAASLGPLPGKGAASLNFQGDDPLGLRSRKNDDAAPSLELSATGIEDMLEALEVVNQKTDKESMGAKAGLIEQHPEVSDGIFSYGEHGLVALRRSSRSLI